MNLMEEISRIGFVPVVALNDAKKAVGLANALEAGGIPLIEVTYRTEQASECIRAIRKNCPNVLVGAGTILSSEQAKGAIEAGAMFIVSPGYSNELVTFCIENDIPVIPGVSNPSEIQQAVLKGLKVLKLFPVEPIGGIPAINFMAAPFPGVKFLPAGGILMSNLGQYLANEHVFACAGGFVARKNMIDNEDWATVTETCKQAIRAELGLEFAHVGVNCETTENARGCQRFFEECFDQNGIEGNSSIFVEKRIELMKIPFRGQNGHIGFYTNSVERALYQLERRGCKIAEDSIRYDAKGKMQSAYLQEEVDGFAIHVVRR